MEDRSETTIFYWSGTGNSFRVASWLHDCYAQHEVQAGLSEMHRENLASLNLEKNKSLILTFPTHGFTAPYHVIRFVLSLPKGDGAKAYCFATRAGTKFGSFHFPGLSGSAMFIVAFLLLLKGYLPTGLMGVDMPTNWYSLHPIQGKKSLLSIVGRAEKKVKQVAVSVIEGKRFLLSFGNCMELVAGALLFPISLVYLFFGRFFLAKLFFADNRCDGCGLCAANCSIQAVQLKGGKKKRPYWKFNCENCMRCAAICPQNAVEAGHSWALLLYLLTSVSTFSYLVSEAGFQKIPGFLGWLLYPPFLFVVVFISYYIFDKLMRIPAINAVFSYTTFTRLPFWGRYKEPNTNLLKIKRSSKR